MARSILNITLQHLVFLKIDNPLIAPHNYEQSVLPSLLKRQLRMKPTNSENNSLDLLIPLATLISIILTVLKMSIAMLEFMTTWQLHTLGIEILSSITIASIPFCLYVLVFHWKKSRYLAKIERLYATVKKCWLILLYLCLIPFFNYYLTTLAVGHK
jgi:hypothetical protein